MVFPEGTGGSWAVFEWIVTFSGPFPCRSCLRQTLISRGLYFQHLRRGSQCKLSCLGGVILQISFSIVFVGHFDLVAKYGQFTGGVYKGRQNRRQLASEKFPDQRFVMKVSTVS